jgi:hypothetical protein
MKLSRCSETGEKRLCTSKFLDITFGSFNHA